MWSFACNMKLGWIAKKSINYKPSIHKGQFGRHCNYTGIKQIDYLVGFESLTRLQLDNNNLTKIEGLDHLITLIELGTTTMNGALQFGFFFSKFVIFSLITKILDIFLINWNQDCNKINFIITNHVGDKKKNPSLWMDGWWC